MYWIKLKNCQNSCVWGYNNKDTDRRNGNLHILYRDPKSMLFEAIFHGNSSQVKRLISSGIDKNSVLHSPVRWEGATVLGTAAFEGHTDIVKYLIQEGTSVNFTDPCLGRSALHWACMGNQYQIVCHLISNGADVNITDKDSVSPLIRATMAKNIDLVKLLMEKGANVNQVDRLRCSALHYATVHGDKELIRTVILGGCVLNNEAIIGKGTPMNNLLHKQDVDNCLLLLDAGYNATKEFILMARDEDVLEPVIKEVKDKIKGFSLKQLCRSKIRYQMKGSNVQQKIHKLEIPGILCKYLCLET